MRVRGTTTRVEYLKKKDVVHIAADGAIGNALINGGRMVPLLILDTTDRADIAELIRLQRHFPGGDVRFDWALMAMRKDVINLVLRFERPAELNFAIEFDLRQNQGILVEQILYSRALYIQAGKPGDYAHTTVEAEKMSIEVPHTGFEKAWDAVYRASVVRQFRGRGLSRRDAERVAKRAIEAQRELTEFRVTPGMFVADGAE